MLTTDNNLKPDCLHIFDDNFTNDIRNLPDDRILAPVDFDTEYKDLLYHRLKNNIIKKILCGDRLPTYGIDTLHRELAFIQAKPVRTHKNFALITSPHPDYPDIPTESILLDLLNKFTVNTWEFVNLKFNKSAKYRAIRFLIYSHFATVDIPFLFTGGEIKSEWYAKLADPKHFNANKRLKAGNKFTSHTKLTKHYLRCQETGEIFIIEIEIVDTIGLFGNKSLKDSLIISGLGHLVADKDITKDLTLARELGYLPITDMIRFSLDYPELNHKYISNDLCLHNMLLANCEQYAIIHKDLGLPERWLHEPKLTVGSTVARLLEQVLCHKYAIDWEHNVKDLRQLVAPANPKKLLDRHDSASLIAKVFGGLCVNNRPLDRVDTGAIVDADEDGAYAMGMMQLLLPMGHPEIVGFPLDGKNQYPTLRDWLKMYQDELVPNAWCAVIDTQGYELKLEHDYFQSWLVPSIKYKHAISDKWYQYCLEQANKRVDNPPTNEGISYDPDGKPITDFLDEGNVKIITREIRSSILTHEGLDFIFNIASRDQRKELLNNIKVVSWMVYPQSTRCDSYKDYLDKVDNHTGSRVFKRNKLRTSLVERNLIDSSHTYWFGDTLGELIIKHLVINRKRYPKKPRHPLNDYYKLLCNTIYGVLCSPYFDISNALIGNNITSRCRHEGWQFMKACYANSTITDGGTFNLNRVIYRRSKNSTVNGNNTVRWKGLEKRNLKLAPIDNCDRIEMSEDGLPILHKNSQVIHLNRNEANKWISDAITNHIKNTFPNTWSSDYDRIKIKVKADLDTNELINVQEIPCQGYFDWEAKDFFNRVTVHGASNYLLENTNTKYQKFAMRAYKIKDHFDEIDFIEDFVKTDNGEIIRKTNHTAPCVEFVTNLSNYGDSLPIPKLQVKTEILKLNAFQDPNLYNKYVAQGLIIGDSVPKVVKLLPFSKSQFKYQTAEQFYSWDRSLMKSKFKHGLTLEAFFMNNDQTLNYDLMLETAYQMVLNGELNPIEYMYNTRGKRDFEMIPHPEQEKELMIKDYFQPLANEPDW